MQIARIREMHSLYVDRAVERQTRKTKGNHNSSMYNDEIFHSSGVDASHVTFTWAIVFRS